MKKMLVIITAALLQLLFSCNKIETPAPVKGKPVTLQAGLNADTKVSHSLDGTTIKPAWEAEDQIEVVFTKDETEVVETFTLSDGIGSSNATFSCASSQLEEGMTYSVYYPSRTCDWSEQDGSVVNLPEYLVAESVTSLASPITLSPRLTYFHFVLSAPTSGSASYNYAIFTKPVGAAKWYKNNETEGYIAVKPQSSYNVNTSMEPLDFYLAILFDGNTSEGTKDSFGDESPSEMRITLQGSKPSGVNLGGVSNPTPTAPNHYYSWKPSKNYQAGKIYKVSGQLKYQSGSAR